MRGPPERKGPALVTPGHDQSRLVSTQDRNEPYAETVEIATAAEGDAISRAVSLTETRSNCVYVGGPSA